MVTDTSIPAEDALHHAIIGLVDLGLIGDAHAMGNRSKLPAIYKAENSPFELLLSATPSVRGMELYGWAQGLPGFTVDKFLTMAKVFATDQPIPRLTKVSLSRLPGLVPCQETLVPLP
jgi:hypothetical protein